MSNTNDVMAPSQLTLQTLSQITSSASELHTFYTSLHARATSTTNIFLSLTSLPSLHARLADLHALPPTLPLYGVPYVLKDNIDAPPYPTTAACPSYSYTPAAAAPAVQRLHDAGAVLLGKVNMDQFACGLVGTRSPHGVPKNPYDSAFIPGGSSSGSAVAVATALCAFALGTDTAGSGRVPAAMCGLVGLKPTKGMISTRGVVPAAESQDCVSIFANHVSDASAVLRVIAAYDETHPFSRRLPPDWGLPTLPCAADERTCEGFVFGIPKQKDLVFNGDSFSESCFRGAVAALRRAGATCVQVDYAPFRDAAALLYGRAFVAERYAAMGKFITDNIDSSRDDFDPNVANIILNGNSGQLAHEVFIVQKKVREYVRLAELNTWNKVDVLMLPSVPCAVTREQVEMEPIKVNSLLGTYTNFVNIMDYCAIAVPASGGMAEPQVPRGVTFVGRAFQEDVVLRIAHTFENLVGRRDVQECEEL